MGRKLELDRKRLAWPSPLPDIPEINKKPATPMIFALGNHWSTEPRPPRRQVPEVMPFFDSTISAGVISKAEFVNACRWLARRSAAIGSHNLAIEFNGIDQFLIVKRKLKTVPSATHETKSIDCLEENHLEDLEVPDKVAYSIYLQRSCLNKSSGRRPPFQTAWKGFACTLPPHLLIQLPSACSLFLPSRCSSRKV